MAKKARWKGGEPDWDAVSDWIADVQSAMRLQAWRIHLDSAPCEDGYDATVQLHRGRWEAHLSLTRHWNRLPPSEQRHVLVHELLHLVMEPVEEAVRGLRDVLDPITTTILEATVDNRVELAIEAISRRVAETLPLPPAPKEPVQP